MWPRLTLQNKNVNAGRPIADVGHLIIDGGSVLSNYASEPEMLTINNDGCIFWKSAPKNLTPAPGSVQLLDPRSLYDQLEPGAAVDDYAACFGRGYRAKSLSDHFGRGSEPRRMAVHEGIEDLFVDEYFRLEQDIDAAGAQVTKWGYCRMHRPLVLPLPAILTVMERRSPNFVVAPGNFGVGPLRIYA